MPRKRPGGRCVASVQTPPRQLVRDYAARVPSAAVVAGAAAVGLLGGVLVPLPAYRLSVSAGLPPRGECGACGRELAGWVRLPNACVGCRARLGPWAWLTGAAGAVGGALLGAALGPGPELALFLALTVFGVALAVIDLACLRLPDMLVIPAFWAVAGALTALALATGRWSDLARAGLGAATLGGLFLVLALLPGGELGYGDVKLAALLGLALGWLGWPAVLLGALLPWLLNGVVVVGLLLTRRVTRRSSVPFGPAMLAGALCAVLVTRL
jgi:leader peptidase (prepilin peptidase)/N-methyltransferase